ncbi:MAG TPA: spermidine synthase [Pseudonocardia sp.]|jgi:spermidine synthase
MEPAEVVERVAGRSGELALLRRSGHAEIVANGVFLMDTRGGASERLLVAEAVRRMPPPGRLLLGGLGVGFSLAEALTHPEVTAVEVVELEPAVVRWNRGPLAGHHGHALDDPRVRCRVTDLLEWLPDGPEGGFDAMCLDIDNGPDWLVSPSNAGLYTDRGIAATVRLLAPGGVLAVWSAHPVPAFRTRMGAALGDVEEHAVAVPRGVPDVLYLGTTPPG